MTVDKKDLTDKDLEQVLVTPNTPSIHYAPIGEDYINITSKNEAWADEAISDSFFMTRWMAEIDTSVLQLIPYVVCISPKGKIFCYSRKRDISEQRLAGFKSIGVGGHVNIDDKLVAASKDSVNTWDIVITGACRELGEELNADPQYVRDNLVQVGTLYTPTDGEINELSTSPRVGEVHIGIIYCIEVPEDIELNPHEGMHDPCFIDSSVDDLANYEYWSRLILLNSDKILETFRDSKNER